MSEKLLGVETLWIDKHDKLTASLDYDEIFSSEFCEGESVALFKTEEGIKIVPTENVTTEINND